MVADVADPVQCQSAIDDSAAALGGLDGVVVNVGIARGARLAGTSAEDWDLTFDVNLRGHFLIAKAALALPITSSIVFIGLIAGLVPGSGSPAYDVPRPACWDCPATSARRAPGSGSGATSSRPV